MLLASLRLALLLLVHSHYIRYVQRIGFYDTLENAWQLTIWSFHMAPLIAGRLWLRECGLQSQAILSASGAAWVLCSLRQREWNLSPWSCSFVGLEVVALLAPLSALPLGGLLALQPVIVTLFWLSMCTASFSADFSFLPLDRHLRRGWRHMLTSSEARARLRHDLGGHGLLQLLFGAVLRSAAVMPSAASGLWICGAYAAFVLAAAVAMPPHRIPYARASVFRLPLVELVVLALVIAPYVDEFRKL